MLELRNITKDYLLNGETVHALRGVSTTFRDNEFVAILGHSGCGKTTLLNIIGGLDHYTSGDLIINGTSTKEYRDRDWDTYRNHSIGFVFQSYNLIPHQTVLANVELALTISGISKTERRRRAIAALEEVGLGDQLKKKPNQMSGGQMQRVAIARALVNDPDILLADEPTGALDSETSVQVMELIRKIARDRLVVMVTHNPELAEEYATRIIRIKDGRITDDSDPVTEEEVAMTVATEKSVSKTAKPSKKSSMSFFTALSLSLNNLMTKKGRTFMTSFAGSIGIIGIALILSLSHGVNTYINMIQREALSSYPLTIEKETADTAAMIQGFMDQNTASGDSDHELDAVYSNTVLYDMFNTMTSDAIVMNNLEKFKEFLDSNEEVQKLASAIQYGYKLNMPVYTTDTRGVIMESDLASLISSVMGNGDSAMINSELSMFSQVSLFEEMLTNDDGTISDKITERYELIEGGRWPEAYNEVVLVVSENNELSDLALFALGMKDNSTFQEIADAALAGKPIKDTGDNSWSYDEFYNKKYKIILPTERYAAIGQSTALADEASVTNILYGSDTVGTELEIVGIIRPIKDAEGITLTGSVAYTRALTEYLVDKTESSALMSAQLADPSVDAILGLPFITDDTVLPTDPEMAQMARDYIATLSVADKAAVFRYISTTATDSYVNAIIDTQIGGLSREELTALIIDAYSAETGVDPETIAGYIAQMSDEEIITAVRGGLYEMIAANYAEEAAAAIMGIPAETMATLLTTTEWTEEQYVMIYGEFVPPMYSESTFEENLELLGHTRLEDPDRINIYCETFAHKDRIAELIAEYNAAAAEDDVITYTDYVALLMSSITDIISGVSYLLIAFVGISLVVSSIMIGIITYISVLERTREIGILRAIGASKRNISGVFNAETLIVGLVAGLIGIGMSCLLNLPINAIIHHLTDLTELNAILPWKAGIVLVAISIFLTVVAGLIPARVAAKKDPVEALRTE